MLSISCKKQDDGTKNISNELIFNIDSTLIGEKISDIKYKFELHPPKNWSGVSESIFKQIYSRIQTLQTQEQISYIPLYLFFDEANGSMLSVNQIIIQNDSMSFVKKMKIFEDGLKQKFDSSFIKGGSFKKENNDFYQFLIRNNEFVNFKITFESDNRYLINFDYIVPVKVYQNEIKAIESSIGSIKINK
ncbi:MAG: hypothetical protein N3A61_05540 [Ignavibacteria bacterium]|nr:hypothetical protein [Ignavibacteria bacterium]